MKKSYICGLIAAMACTLVACNSDDPNDACTKKQYSESESPYLRTDPEATVEVTRVFNVSTIDQPVYVSLKEYATVFHKALGMTVDETLAALDRGEFVLHNINVARQVWDRTPSNDGNGGWYYSAAGFVADPSECVFNACYDKATKSICVRAVNSPAAGTVTTLNLGIAEDSGRDLDRYVRFAIEIQVKDPSIVEVYGRIPEGDYNSWSLVYADYDEQIQAAMGMTAKEFSKLCAQAEETGDYADDPMQVFLMKNGERVTAENGLRPQTTTNWFGWWLDKDFNIISWGDSCYMFLEAGDGCYNFGRFNNNSSGDSVVVLIDYALTANLDKHITFMVYLTFD